MHTILLLAALTAQPNPDYFQASESSVEATAPILGIGRTKYNRNRIQRQNTPSKTNQRTKKLLRKNGLAQVVTWEEVCLG
jgi:hypothetical protein